MVGVEGGGEGGEVRKKKKVLTGGKDLSGQEKSFHLNYFPNSFSPLSPGEKSYIHTKLVLSNGVFFCWNSTNVEKSMYLKIFI